MQEYLGGLVPLWRQYGTAGPSRQYLTSPREIIGLSEFWTLHFCVARFQIARTMGSGRKAWMKKMATYSEADAVISRIAVAAFACE